MLLLSIDSSGNTCSAALLRDGATLAHRREEMARGHAAVLPVMVEALLGAAECGAQSLDAVAVSTGPGSFTGLRIGLAAAKGLALAIDRPLIGVTCFEALAARISARDAERGGKAAKAAKDANKANDVVLLAIESRRAELFVQARAEAGAILLPDQALTPPAVRAALTPLLAPGARLLIEGDAALPIAKAFTSSDSGPESGSDGASGGMSPRPVVILEDGRGVDARDVGQAAFSHASLADEGGYKAGLAPYYLRLPDVSVPGSGPGSKP